MTAARAGGTCKMPSTCMGATIDFIEKNVCSLASGVDGVCCVSISVESIFGILDSHHQREDIPNIHRADQEEDVFLRFGGNTFEPKLSGGFASDEPAADIVVDETFIDDTVPTESHLRFNAPRNDVVKIDKASQIFLAATRMIKSEKA